MTIRQTYMRRLPAFRLTPQVRLSLSRERIGYLAISVLSLFVFLGMWEIAAVTGAIDPRFFPAPSYLKDEFVLMVASGRLQSDMMVSTIRVLIGFALSASVGIPLGILLGSSQVLRWIIEPIISVIRPMPSLAWIPLSLLWLGMGESQKYAIVFMGTLAPLVVFVTDATFSVDGTVIRAAKNLGASRFRVMLEVVLPGALPSILSGLKVTLALAWTCIISAEMVGAAKGLGYVIWNAKDWGNTSQVIVGMLMISATVLVLDLLFRFGEAALLPWKRTERTE